LDVTQLVKEFLRAYGDRDLDRALALVTGDVQ